MTDLATVQAASDLARAITRQSRDKRQPIVYLQVLAVNATTKTVTVNFDGQPYTVPADQCFGGVPSPGDVVAVHVNGTELNILSVPGWARVGVGAAWRDPNVAWRSPTVAWRAGGTPYALFTDMVRRIAEALLRAGIYTNEKMAEAIYTSALYTNQKFAEALLTAATYTNDKFAEALTLAAIYANEQDAIMLLRAALYTNDRIAALDNETLTIDFTTDPGLFGPHVLTRPDGQSDHDLSIVAGRQRFTVDASHNGNLREIWGIPGTGKITDSEMRATWFDASADLSDANADWQPGNAHRLTYTRQDFATGPNATSGTTTTLTDTTRTWNVNAFVGALGDPFLFEWYVTVTAGTGAGQTRRIRSNTASTLTVTPAWTTAPDATSEYDIWSWENRAIVWSLNVFFNAHFIINCHVWDTSDLTQLNTPGVGDFDAYLRPGGVYRQFPWHVKSRVVGMQSDFAIWVDGDPEPAYGTPGQSASVTIPAGYEGPGECGVYMAHIPQSGWLEVDDVTITWPKPKRDGFQIINPAFGEEVIIDRSLGSTVMILLTDSCAIGDPIPATDPTEAPELNIVFVQDEQGLNGVIWGPMWEHNKSSPLVDTAPGSVTTMTFRHAGLAWLRWDSTDTEEATSRPALSCTFLPDFSDGRASWNCIGNYGQDDATLGPDYGDARQLKIWHRAGDFFGTGAGDYDIDHRAVIAYRENTFGPFTAWWPMKSDAWYNEMGSSGYNPETNLLGERIWRVGAAAAGPDAHNGWAIACSTDGFVWVCGNHHSDPLHFIRSAIPLDEWDTEGMVDPGWVAPGLIAARGAGGVRPSQAALTAAHEWEVSYPAFVRLRKPPYTLLLFYRSGYSGNGYGYVCDRYVPSGTPGVAGTWERVGKGASTLFVETVRDLTFPWDPNIHSWYPHQFLALPSEDSVYMAGTWRYGNTNGAGASNDNRHFDFAKLTNLDGPGPMSAEKMDGTPIGGNALTVTNMERIRATGQYAMSNSGAGTIDHLSRPHWMMHAIPDGIPTPYGAQSHQIADIHWDGSTWRTDLVTRTPNRIQGMGSDEQTFTSGGEAGGIVTLNMAPHPFVVGNKVIVKSSTNTAFNTPTAERVELISVTPTQVQYAAPVNLDGTGAITGGGSITRSDGWMYLRTAMFAVGGRIYITYITPLAGKAETLRLLDITDPDNTFETVLMHDVPFGEHELDSRSLYERGEVHIGIHPSGGGYADAWNFQAATMLSIDTKQIDKLMSGGGAVPKMRVIGTARLDVTSPNYITNVGVRQRGTRKQQILGPVPIHKEYAGRLVFARLRAQIQNLNGSYRGRMRCAYLFGGYTNDAPYNFLGPSTITNLGTTEFQPMSTPWVPIPHTALFDGSLAEDANGLVIGTLYMHDADEDRTCIARVATLELAVYDNVTGTVAEYVGRVE
jgi:hypothetical protein